MNLARALGRLSRSLYARLVLVYLASLIVMSVATAWIAVEQFDQLGREWLQRNQIHLAAHLARRFQAPLAIGPNSQAVQQTVQSIEGINPALSIYVLDRQGRVVGTGAGNRCALGEHIDIAPVHALLAKMPMLPVYASPPCESGSYVFSATHIHYGPHHRPGYLLVVLETDTHISMARMWQTSSIARSLLVAVFCALLLSAALGLLLFARLTRRFSNLTRAVQRFADGDHSQRIAVSTDDEIGRAARAFNHMAATIEAQVSALREDDRQRRELVANLSHDFRTPLTALRGYAETLRQNAPEPNSAPLDGLLANVARLTRLAEQLSLLAQVEIAERPLQIETFPLAELAYDIAGKFRPQAEAAGITLALACPAALPVAADLELIDRALSNLVDNALHATDPGGRVTITALAVADRVLVEVSDTGVGIPADEIGLVTQRFYRTRRGRERGHGSGLGLAIVAEVCARHATRLALHSDRHGTIARFELPRA